MGFAEEVQQGQRIAPQPEPGNGTHTGPRQVRVMAEGLAGGRVAHMHLDDGAGDGRNGVAQGDGRVAEGTPIEDDAVGRETDLMQLVDEGALVIALEIAQLMLRKLRCQALEEGIKRNVSVNLALTQTGEVQVGPVDDDDSHAAKYARMASTMRPAALPSP